MPTYIQTLTKGEDEIIPRTRTDAITTPNGTPLETVINAKADVSDIPTKTSDLTNDNGFLTAHQSLASYSLISETGNKINLECNNTTYQLTAKLYDKNNTLLSTSSVIDLPIEQLVVSMSFDAASNELIITLKNGSTTRVSISSIISGLATESWVEAKGYLTSHQSLAAYRTSSAQDTIDSGKADKVSNATNGNFAGLDTNGNLTDSGYDISDFLTYSDNDPSNPAPVVADNLRGISGATVGQAAIIKTIDSNGVPTLWEAGESGGADIDDTTTAADKVWSSQKTNNEIQTVNSSIADTYNSSATYSDGAYAIKDGVLKKYSYSTGLWTAVQVTEEMGRFDIALTISCVDQDNTQISGNTVTITNANTGTIYQSFTYPGANVTVRVPGGVYLKIDTGSLTSYGRPMPRKATIISATTMTFIYHEGSGLVFGFHIDGNESDPETRVTYLEDALNLTPAHMDFDNDAFDYGSWEDAFFMPRPCMLKYDGTVDYYLDPDDYTKREDGVTASDIADLNYGGNAMMEWGRDGKQIWYKVVPDAEDMYSGSVYISDSQMDVSYKCWSFMDANDNITEHFYTPIYNGYIDTNGRLRSISGNLHPWSTTGGAQNEITASIANNIDPDKHEWYTEVLADVMLINFLLILMGKSTNTQEVFGYGHYHNGSSQYALLNTGTMDAKGLFWGASENAVKTGVKVFGMENWWGNMWRRYAGHCGVGGKSAYKFTWGTADGTSAIGYNLTGENYKQVTVYLGGSSGGYIAKESFVQGDGMFPTNASATDSTYYCDGLWYANRNTYALHGGACDSGLSCGAFAVGLYDVASYSNWYVGAALSCKPLAQVG